MPRSSPTASSPTASIAATPTTASTTATRAPNPATSPTAATTSNASTTSAAAPTTTAATSTIPATLALAAVALRTSRISPDVLSNRDVGVGKGGGGAPLKERRARSATSITYSNCTSLSCEEMLLEE
ncbi:unnamed protein product, partial [Closterium sp. NIES-54]